MPVPIRGVTVPLPQPGVTYELVTDPSSGRHDAWAGAIGHSEGGRVVVDALFHRPAPCVPSRVMAELAEWARPYRISRAHIDRHAEPLITDGLNQVGLLARVLERNTSEIYVASLRHLRRSVGDPARSSDVASSVGRLVAAQGRDRQGDDNPPAPPP